MVFSIHRIHFSLFSRSFRVFLYMNWAVLFVYVGDEINKNRPREINRMANVTRLRMTLIQLYNNKTTLPYVSIYIRIYLGRIYWMLYIFLSIAKKKKTIRNVIVEICTKMKQYNRN